MTELRIGREQIDDAVLAVSECATNALQHAGKARRYVDVVPAELWVWARTSPSPELVVSVFDSDHDHLPHTSHADPLDEHGKGITILTAVTSQWGNRRTRSRLTTPTARGKAVWFSTPLPPPWPAEPPAITPAVAAHKLLHALTTRNIKATGRSDERGISVVQASTLNIWVQPQCFAFRDNNGGYTRLPLIDLQETIELVLHQLDGPERTPST